MFVFGFVYCVVHNRLISDQLDVYILHCVILSANGWQYFNKYLVFNGKTTERVGRLHSTKRVAKYVQLFQHSVNKSSNIHLKPFTIIQQFSYPPSRLVQHFKHNVRFPQVGTKRKHFRGFIIHRPHEADTGRSLAQPERKIPE